MPAILALPFVAVFGREFPAQTYSALYGGLATGLVYLVFGRLGLALRVRDRLALTAVFAFGTCFWFIAIGGSAWYFAHVSAVLLLAASVLCALTEAAGVGGGAAARAGGAVAPAGGPRAPVRARGAAGLPGTGGAARDGSRGARPHDRGLRARARRPGRHLRHVQPRPLGHDPGPVVRRGSRVCSRTRSTRSTGSSRPGTSPATCSRSCSAAGTTWTTRRSSSPRGGASGSS